MILDRPSLHVQLLSRQKIGREMPVRSVCDRDVRRLSGKHTYSVTSVSNFRDLGPVASVIVFIGESINCGGGVLDGLDMPNRASSWAISGIQSLKAILPIEDATLNIKGQEDTWDIIYLGSQWSPSQPRDGI